jgi:hypothetical protein
MTTWWENFENTKIQMIENQLEINFEAIPKNRPELAETWTWRFL